MIIYKGILKQNLELVESFILHISLLINIDLTKIIVGLRFVRYALQESGITYNNTKKDYAAMDNKFSKSRMGIGYSSNLAQLAMTYYWTELQKDNPDENKLKELYDNFIILSVLAQVIIDG